jgi:hypothetical protein
MAPRFIFALVPWLFVACGGGDAPRPPSSDSGAAAKPGKPAPTVEPTADAEHGVAGDKSKAASFTAHLAAKPSYKKGQEGTIVAVVVAADDYKINQEYPYKFTLDAAPAGISYPSSVVRDVARGNKKAIITILFKPDAAGKATVSGECSLSVCTEKNCIIDKVKLAVDVTVEE